MSAPDTAAVLAAIAAMRARADNAMLAGRTAKLVAWTIIADASALADVAEAAARLAERGCADRDGYCQQCGEATDYDRPHAPDCPALALDAALARLETGGDA